MYTPMEVRWKTSSPKKGENYCIKIKVISIIINFGSSKTVKDRNMYIHKDGKGVWYISFIQLLLRLIHVIGYIYRRNRDCQKEFYE